MKNARKCQTHLPVITGYPIRPSVGGNHGRPYVRRTVGDADPYEKFKKTLAVQGFSVTIILFFQNFH